MPFLQIRAIQRIGLRQFQQVGNGYFAGFGKYGRSYRIQDTVRLRCRYFHKKSVYKLFNRSLFDMTNTCLLNLPNLRCMERLIKTIRKTTEANAPATSETIKAKKIPPHSWHLSGSPRQKNNHSQDNTIDAKNFVLIPCTFRGVSSPFLTWKSIRGTF